MEVMATLLVVGVMDEARADIQGNGHVLLTSAERVSQVCAQVWNQHVRPHCLCMRVNAGQIHAGAAVTEGAE